MSQTRAPSLPLRPPSRSAGRWRAGVLGALVLALGSGEAFADQSNCAGNLSRSNLANPVVEMRTSLGSVCLELLEDQAPATVANFLAYLRRGDIDGTFFHRSVPGFVLQGGGFRVNDGGDLIERVASDPAVVNEPCTRDIPVPGGGSATQCSERGNKRGTVAMAKLGSDPNSATNQWFFNAVDNRPNLDNQNGGFTVFASVLGNGMQVVDQIMSRPTHRTWQLDLNFIPNSSLEIFSSLPVLAQPTEPASDFGCFDVDELAVPFTDAATSCGTNAPGFSHDPCERGVQVSDPTTPLQPKVRTVSGACGVALAQPEDFCPGGVCDPDNVFAWGTSLIETDGVLRHFLRQDGNGDKIPYGFTPAQIQASDDGFQQRREVMMQQSAQHLVYVDAAVLSPEIVSPTPGATLGGTSQVLTIDQHDTVAQAWRLSMGSTPGGVDFGVVEVDDPDAITFPFTNLPFNGETVHATLAWRVNNQWRDVNSRRHVFTAPALGDSDGDGVPDATESLDGTNPNDPDSDDDNLTDGEEAALGTDPLVQDTDGDTLNDDVEVAAGTDPLLRDTDGDDLNDDFELANGLDPTDSRDSARDADRDNFSNLEEQRKGTDVNDPNDWPMPAMVTPPDLTGHTEVFDWSWHDDLPVRRWRVRVGTTEGGGQILGSKVIRDVTELEVVRLPTQGGTVFVQLGLDRGRGFRNLKSFQFNAADLPEPTITPESGSLGGIQSEDTATFTLVKNGNDVTHWKLEVLAPSATTRDRRLFLRSLRGDVPSVLATKLPTYGEPILVRLSYRLSAGPFQLRTFQLQADFPGVPEILTPDPRGGGADALATGTSAEGNVVFTWTDNGQPVRDWRLELGSTRGGRDLYRSPRLRGDILTVDTRGVFPQPTVFARLHYRIRGQVDRFVDYRYNAVTGEVRPFYAAVAEQGPIAPIRNDGADRFSARGRPCRGGERGGHQACLPAGVMKVMVLPASVGSCATVSVRDELNALEWVCRDTVPVEVVSVALRDGLAALIDTGSPGSPAFALNEVIVEDDGIEVVRSGLERWWSTPVVAMPADGQMRESDTIHVVENASPDVALVMDRAPRSALLVAPSVSTAVTGAGTEGGTVVKVSRSPFAAVSGAFAATGENTVVEVDRSPFATVTNVTARDGVTTGEGRRAVPGIGIDIDRSHNAKLAGIEVTGNEVAGLRLDRANDAWVEDVAALRNGTGVLVQRASRNAFERIRAGHNALVGIHLELAGDNRLSHLMVNGNGANAEEGEGHGLLLNGAATRRNVIGFVQAFANAGDGVHLNRANNTLLSGVTSFNNLGDGLRLVRTNDATLTSLAALNNHGAGLHLDDRAQRNRVEDVVSAHNTAGVALTERARRNTFNGLLAVGGNGTACLVEAGTGDLNDVDCAVAGQSTHTLVTGIDAVASLAGKVTEGGSGDGTASEASLAADPQALLELGGDPARARNRGFGREGGVFPDAGNRGPCQPGEVCRIWDGAAAAGDTGNGGEPVLAGVLATPDALDVLVHRLRRNERLLRHASEVIGDGIGDDDGLCESGEACNLDLNIGAFQGEPGDGVPDVVIGFDPDPPQRRAPPRVEGVDLDAREGATVP